MSLQKYSFQQQLPAFLERPVTIASNNLADFFGPLKIPQIVHPHQPKSKSVISPGSKLNYSAHEAR